MANSGFVRIGGSGCLLPFLIIFNFFFGKFIFHSTRMWLGIEVILILILILKINIMAHKINQQFWPKGSGRASSSPSHRPGGDGSGSNSQNHKPGGGGWASANPRHKSKGEVIDVEGDVVEEDKKLR